MTRITSCAMAVTRCFCRAFYGLGESIAHHPVPFIALPLLAFATLGVFFLFADHHSNIEDMYTPRNSRARQDRLRVKNLFTDRTGDNFNPMSTNDHALGVAVILQHHNRSNILNEPAFQLTRNIADQIRNITMKINVDIVVPKTTKRLDSIGLNVTQEGLVTSTLTTTLHSDEVHRGMVQYPFWDSPWGPLDLSRTMGRVNVTDSGRVISAEAVRLIFNFRHDTNHLKHLSLEWEKHYVVVAADLNYGFLDYAYASSHSLGNELDKGTRGDIRFFSMTFTLMILYACLVTSGGDCVTSRTLLAGGGVLSTALGILGSLGVVSLMRVPFVNIVGCMPFLVLGIGMDDIFLMMAAWSGTLGNRDLTVPERLGSSFRSAGIGITITSLTDGIAFALGGMTSVFDSIRNFCIYTGTAVFLSYVCHVTFFGACMAYHGRRVYSSRHSIICRIVKPQEGMGHTCCFRFCCRGSPPEETGDDESLCEKVPRLVLPHIVLRTPVKIIVLLAFAGFLGVSVWGAMDLQQGLLLRHLCLPTSFYYKYNDWEEAIFGITFPISFVVDEPVSYANRSVAMEVGRLLARARQDKDINDLGAHCWLVDFFLSPHFDTSSQHAFVQNLTRHFLLHNPHYLNDIVIDDQNDVIIASRCHVYTKNVRGSTEQAELMLRMREIADSSTIFKVFAYQPAFVFFEQYAAIVPNTLLTVAVTLAAMFVVTLILLAHPLMVFLVLFNVIMIVVGIFGFMHLWGLTLSSITMIHIIMSVGFSVDFSAHVCAAYMTSQERGRQARAHHALTHASGPILNGGLSSFVGIVVLGASESYIFRSLFKIMFLVILFGLLHAVFLMPVILSLIGPEFGPASQSTDENHAARSDSACNSTIPPSSILSSLSIRNAANGNPLDTGRQLNGSRLTRARSV